MMGAKVTACAAQESIWQCVAQTCGLHPSGQYDAAIPVVIARLLDKIAPLVDVHMLAGRTAWIPRSAYPCFGQAGSVMGSTLFRSATNFWEPMYKSCSLLGAGHPSLLPSDPMSVFVGRVAPIFCCCKAPRDIGENDNVAVPLAWNRLANRMSTTKDCVLLEHKAPTGTLPEKMRASRTKIKEGRGADSQKTASAPIFSPNMFVAMASCHICRNSLHARVGKLPAQCQCRVHRCPFGLHRWTNCLRNTPAKQMNASYPAPTNNGCHIRHHTLSAVQ